MDAMCREFCVLFVLISAVLAQRGGGDAPGPLLRPRQQQRRPQVSSPDYYDQRERAEPISRTILDESDYDYVDDVEPVVVPVSNRRSSSSSGGSSAAGNRNNVLAGIGADCRAKTRHIPHEKYCDLYYHTTGCDDGQAILRSCPNGLVFTGTGRHGLLGVCDYPHNVECGKRDRHPPIQTEHCDWLYGIFGHETSCTRYWTCWNGTATEQFCIGGLLYNEETHACDWPQNVVGCQKHPLCKDDANGNVPLGKSCNRYWACQGGYPRLQRCPAMLVFDKKRKRCLPPPTEDCPVPATTPPPVDYDDDDDVRDDRRGGGQQQQQQQQQRRNGNNGNRRRGGDDRRGGGGGQGLEERRSQQQQQPQSVAQQQNIPFQLPEGATLLNRGN